MATTALVDKTENLAHGSSCPAFTRVTVVKGTPATRSPQALSAGQLVLDTGTVRFLNNTTGSELASMTTTSGAVLEQSVAACRIEVNPDGLRELVRLEAVYPNGRVLTDFNGEPLVHGALPLVPGYRDQVVRPNQDCPAFVYAVVTRGTAAPTSQQFTPLGETQLTAGTITFRHRTTKATLATMSTQAGTRLSTSVAECEMVVIGDPRLADRVEVTLALAS